MPPSPLLDASPELAPAIISLDVGGMKCAGCVQAVERQLTQHPGVVSATVNLVTEVATVEYRSGWVDPASLAKDLTEAGFPSQLRDRPQSNHQSPQLDGVNPAERREQEMRQQIQRTAIAGVLLLLSAVGHLNQLGWHLPILHHIGFHWGLATLALIGPGRTLILDGWRGLRHNTPNMNTLVGIGTITAYTTSSMALAFPQLGWECFFDEPVMLLGFILLGRTLESHARRKATTAMQALLSLQPSLARLIPAQPDQPPTSDPTILLSSLPAAIEVPASQVTVGDWLQILPGEKIPVDGELIAGQTTVDESMLTGEAIPVLKLPGATVAAGTLNQNGVIAVQATRTGNDTTLAQIIALVETAQTRKAPMQRLADTIAGYFTYGVMAIATLTFLFWYWIGIPWLGIDRMDMGMVSQDHLMHVTVHSSPLLLSMKLAIAVLVVACPCALGLATPTAILVGSGIGAERGLLIRGGDVLETIHRLDTIIFDKTGTLTTGSPVITDCLPLVQGVSYTTLLQLAAAVETGTRHPLAEAIRKEAQRQGLPTLKADFFQTVPGLGVSACIEQQTVRLGNEHWLQHHSIAISDDGQRQASLLASAGKTVIFIAVEAVLVGIIAALDTLRPDATTAIDRLRQMGLRVMMMTGDQPTVAQAIAHTLQLPPNDVLAEVRPDGKATMVAVLQSQGHCVAMVGDGINDAPALAQADVSISLHSATDVAIETAEIILMHNHLIDVVESIRLSRATFNKIRQNLFWAFLYNILAIPIAAGCLMPSFGIVLDPAIAGLLMAFSSVSVVTNSLLLYRSFPPMNPSNSIVLGSRIK